MSHFPSDGMIQVSKIFPGGNRLKHKKERSDIRAGHHQGPRLSIWCRCISSVAQGAQLCNILLSPSSALSSAFSSWLLRTKGKRNLFAKGRCGPSCISKAASSHLTSEVVFPQGKDLKPLSSAPSRKYCSLRGPVLSSQPLGWFTPSDPVTPSAKVSWNTRAGAFGELTVVLKVVFKHCKIPHNFSPIF